MGGFNLPPGCSVSDLPGNSAEESAWEDLLVEVGESGLTATEARVRWESQPRLLAACELLKRTAMLGIALNGPFYKHWMGIDRFLSDKIKKALKTKRRARR